MNHKKSVGSIIPKLKLLFIVSTITIELLISPVILAANSADNQISIPDSNSTDNTLVNFTLRMGQGGFRDKRSPENVLGGGQLTLDIKPVKFPVGISISREYYTNSADPTHSYEIESLYAFNIIYDRPFRNNKSLNYFLSAGLGRLKVPKDSEPNERVSGNHINLEAGINYLVYKKVGIYGAVKYLRAHKTENNIDVVDFNELIMLLGISFGFSY